jgi:hypothetical protein
MISMDHATHEGDRLMHRRVLLRSIVPIIVMILGQVAMIPQVITMIAEIVATIVMDHHNDRQGS